jgi:hypothetical protein
MPFAEDHKMIQAFSAITEKKMNLLTTVRSTFKKAASGP